MGLRSYVALVGTNRPSRNDRNKPPSLRSSTEDWRPHERRDESLKPPPSRHRYFHGSTGGAIYEEQLKLNVRWNNYGIRRRTGSILEEFIIAAFLPTTEIKSRAVLSISRSTSFSLKSRYKISKPSNGINITHRENNGPSLCGIINCTRLFLLKVFT